jgi:hypothetical protein
VKLIANHTVHYDEGTAQAGESFTLEDEKEALRLIARGAARRASAEEAEAESSDGKAGDDGKTDPDAKKAGAKGGAS